MITGTALEELYTIAKKFDADVIHCEKYIELENDESRVYSYQTGEFVKTPSLITSDFKERVNDLYNGRFIDTLWSKLIRRDFLIETGINMINGMAADAFVSYCLICSAKKYVRVPNIVNIYRRNDSSITKKNRTVQEKIHTWMDSLISGFKYFDEFLSRQEFFKQKPDVKFTMLEIWVKAFCSRADRFQSVYAQIPSYQLDEIIRRELEKVKDKTSLTAFLFSRMNIFNVQLNRQNAMLYQMNAHIQKQNEVIKNLQAEVNRLQQK